MSKKTGDTPVLDYKYQDKRRNIPTYELRDFAADQEKAPKDILYPRDPSLDPQLVWKGKDEQDREDLAVPPCPFYIQEKILPRHHRRRAGAGPEGQARAPGVLLRRLQRHHL